MKKSILFIMASICVLTISSCKKKKNEEDPSSPNSTPNVSSMVPTSGPRNTFVFIKGSNLGTNPADLSVSFNDVQGTVLAAYDTMITCVTPANAGTGTVKVEKNSQLVSGSTLTFTFQTGVVVSTLGGGPNGAQGYANGILPNSLFRHPTKIVRDASGNLFVADLDNYRIRKISTLGIVTTFAGRETNGTQDGNGTNAGFYVPYGLSIDQYDNMYVGEYDACNIRKITPNADVTTIAGSGSSGYSDGNALSSLFYQPIGMAIDGSGNIFVADYANNRIRKITPGGVVSTFAGSGNPTLVDGTGTSANFNGPFALAFDASGNLIVSDYLNHAIRKITPAGVVTTLAGSGSPFYQDGTGSAASFNRPAELTIDGNGNIYVCDAQNNRIRKVTSAGVVTTVAGSNSAGLVDGNASSAEFNYPMGICGDFTNNVLYVTDFSNHVIRKITLD